ncbi:hypothetical protein JCM3765_007177 [Sporobolomyces pararoseus]
MRLLSLSPSLTALVATLSLFPPVHSKAAPPNPDQLYALQQAAYLAGISSTDPISTQISVSPPRRDQHRSDKSFHKKIKKGLDKRLRKEIEDEWSKDSSHRLVDKMKRGDSPTLRKRQNRMEKLRKRTQPKNHQHLNRPHSDVVPEFDVQKMRMGPPETSKPNSYTRTELVKRKGGMFKGVSSYYLFALDDGPRRAVLDAVKAGGFSVVRIFLSGVHGNCKGSGNGPVPDLEPDKVGEYDDTILYKIDKLMADCADRGLKLMIALSDRYALGFWSTNSYAVQLSIIQPSQQGAQSLKIKNAGAFYSNSWAIKMFEQRMSHALNHENQLMGGQKWKDLSSVVYAFEAQNEPQGYMEASNPSWVCDRSNFIASQVSGSGIQVSSGGGVDVSSSLQGWATDCGSIDIVSVHDYGTNGWNIAGALDRAQSNHPDKTIMMGEWGLTGSNKAGKISEFVSAFESKGIPWMYWQVTQPGAGAQDFEVWTGEPAWGALTGGSYSYSAPDSGSSNGSKGGKNDGGSKSSSKSSDNSATSSDSNGDSSSSSASRTSSSSKAKSTKSSSAASDDSSNCSTVSAGDGAQYSTVTDDGSYSTISPDQVSDYSVVSDSGPTSSSGSKAASKTSWSSDSGPTPTPSSSSDSQGSPVSSSDSTTEQSPSSSSLGIDSATQDANVAVDNGSQWSTISPDDLSGYSIVAQDAPPPTDSSLSPSSDEFSTSTSIDSAQPPTESSIPVPTDSSFAPLSTDNSTSVDQNSTDSSLSSVPDGSMSPLPSPAGDSASTLPTLTGDSTSLLPSSTDSSASSTDSLIPTDSVVSTEVPSPTDSTPTSATLTSDSLPIPTQTAADGSIIPFPNCNYTQAQVLDGTVSINPNTTITLLPSGIYCNTTILPHHSSASSDVLPTPSPAADASASPLLVFSSDPSTIIPDFSTDSPPDHLAPETPSATTPQENDTALAAPAEIPTPSPSPAQDFHYITLDADALATIDLSGYSILAV